MDRTIWYNGAMEVDSLKFPANFLAVGFGLLYAKVFEVFGDKKHLEEAKLCASIVYKYGLLKKGLGLCHGT